MAARAATVIDHISFGVCNIAQCIDYLEGELGAVPCEIGPAGSFNWAQWAFAAQARIELIEPVGSAGFLQRFLAARGPGVHHVTWKVPSLADAAARATALGYEVIGYDDRQPSWKECFLHPKQALGVVIQMAEAHPELGVAPAEPMPFPCRVEPRPEPAHVHSLVMNAPEPGAVLRLFEQLLHGTLEREPDGLMFRWPDSPHRILVQLDAARAAGVKEVRLQSSRKLGLPPADLLGTPIVQVATNTGG
ncbi:MAG TPA: VOC family protein [Polyangiales bacterium]